MADADFCEPPVSRTRRRQGSRRCIERVRVTPGAEAMVAAAEEEEEEEVEEDKEEVKGGGGWDGDEPAEGTGATVTATGAAGPAADGTGRDDADCVMKRGGRWILSGSRSRKRSPRRDDAGSRMASLCEWVAVEEVGVCSG